jgi:protein-S-isoprenylcysteine O-methyltransferase Ste14
LSERSAPRSGRAGWGRQLLAILLLPAMTTIVIPGVLVATGGTEIGWGYGWPWKAIPPLLGAATVIGGLRLVVETIGLLGTRGEGTLAPWDPTRRLVVRGPYRRVRNPMITGVAAIQLGEAVLLGSPSIAVWFGLFGLANAVYMPFVEEPGLLRRFGSDYEEYRRAVPRWIPRRTAWTPPDHRNTPGGGVS